MPVDLAKQYEKLLQQAIGRAQKQIRQVYEQSIVEISSKASTVTLKSQPFSLSLYPLLNNTIESKVADMHKSIYGNIVKSVGDSWDLSNRKNDIIVDKRLAGKIPNQKARQILYDPNKPAFDAFISRKEKGLNLSERVWNSLDPFKKEMEQALGLSINKGQSATSMATELKQYLNNPDKLFRRVRDEEGKLVLSKKAREYHPGQGVYRSSYKNALRLSGTENNIAYRTADFERWQTLPFVTGVEIHLSKNHPRYDICDPMAGKYPKDFKFSGWHPNCICYQTPMMLSDEEYDKLEDQILAGEQPSVPKQSLIKQPPAAFGKWVNDNQQRIDGWKNKPYWIKDNPQFINQVKASPSPISKSTDSAILKKIELQRKRVDALKEKIRNGEFVPSGTYVKETKRLTLLESKVTASDIPKPAEQIAAKPIGKSEKQTTKKPVEKPNAQTIKATSISDQLTNVDPTIRAHVDEAFKAINEVHKVPDGLTNIFIKAASEQELGGSTVNGAFLTRRALGESVGINLNAAKSKSAIASTLTHELGHFFDFDVIGGKGFVSSVRADSPLKGIIKAARETSPIKEYTAAATEGRFRGAILSDKGKKYFSYMQSDDEIFARAYAQFIAKRSSNPNLKEIIRLQANSKGKNVAFQWSDKEFQKIDAEIEKLFKKLGWM